MYVCISPVVHSDTGKLFLYEICTVVHTGTHTCSWLYHTYITYEILYTFCTKYSDVH